MRAAASLFLRAMPVAMSGAAHAAVIAALVVSGPFLPRHPAAGENVIDFVLVDEASGGQGAVADHPAETPRQAQPEPVSLDIAPPEPPLPVKISIEKPPPDPVMPEPEIVSSPPPPEVPVIEPRPAAQPKPVPRPLPARAHPVRADRRNDAPSSAPRSAARPGAGTGAAATGGGNPGGAVSGAAYAGRVRAILQGRANALGIEDHQGAVGVSFVIGAAGRVESHAITRSSGSVTIDRLIRGMMASAVFPVPPGGRFSGQVTIRIE